MRSLESLTDGEIQLVCADERYSFGDPHAALRTVIEIHNDRFFTRALFGGDTGMGESYMDGEWSSPDLITAVRLAIRNAPVLEARNRFFSAARRVFDAVEQRLLENSLTGSAKNIRAHYDLGNDFFALFLDPTLTYSCAYYSSPNDSLAEAQAQKLDRICQKLRLGRGTRVLEIGTGWGSFAFHAARRYGCHVTTTTISRKQHDFVAKRLKRDSLLSRRIELLSMDYRELAGVYDAIVSVEMFEAVGFRHYDRFFSTCDRLLAPDGAMLLQAITHLDQHFATYLRKADWTQKYIFPGSQLASISGITASLARATKLALYDFEDIGMHYAQTLMDWRERFHANIAEVKRMGFDDPFIRMWDFYLAACAASFWERYNSDVQLVLTKASNESLRSFESPEKRNNITKTQVHSLLPV